VAPTIPVPAVAEVPVVVEIPKPTVVVQKAYVPITREQYLMGREVEYPTDIATEGHIADLLVRVNSLLSECPIAPTSITSGYRPGKYNVAAGGAKRSAHLTGQAVDLADPSKSFKEWLVANQELLVKYDLYMEHPIATPTWCHLQTRPTGVRIFRP
jgi:hypothetical protein